MKLFGKHQQHWFKLVTKESAIWQQELDAALKDWADIPFRSMFACVDQFFDCEGLELYKSYADPCSLRILSGASARKAYRLSKPFLDAREWENLAFQSFLHAHACT